MTFSVGLPAKFDNPVNSSQVRFRQFRISEGFVSVATSAVTVGHSSNDLEFFIDRTFRASIPSFSALPKLINAFPYFPRNSGRGALTSIGVTRENMPPNF